MRRPHPALALLLVLLVAASAAAAGIEWCAGDCAGDGQDGACALEACCSCCVHSRVDPPLAVSLRSAPPRGELLPSAGGPAPAPPDPRDILHVPKRLPQSLQ